MRIWAMIPQFSVFFSAIFALFLFSVGATLCLYSVNKSREIGGWAVWFFLAAIPPVWAGLWFLFAGVFGWDL